MHLLKANTSLWVNRWTEVYDFTPNKKADDGTPNWRCVPELYQGDFIVGLDRMKAMLKSLQSMHGDEIKSIRGHENDDLL